MFDAFGHSFDRDQLGPPFERLPVFGDEALESILNQVEQAAEEDRYPLQLQFYESLRAHALLLPVPQHTGPAEGIPLMSMENMHGETGLPVFTSELTLGLWAEDDSQDYLAVPFLDLCRYALEAKVDFIVVNTAGPYGCEISFHDFSYLAEGLLPPPAHGQICTEGRKPGEVVIEKNTPMRLTSGSGLPPDLMDRLYNVFQHHHELISRVYVFDVGFNEGPLQPALAVRMPEGREKEWEMILWPNMQAVMHEMLERREVINVFLLNQSGSMETHLSQVAQPIYRSPQG